ncbi:MAG: hypothetical protein A3G52_03700 [Candidatus Taylorbacteria bacterium RIFCSPLOWO2_12_FULL_43_20]|uniref:DUF541 domain-containing protein n=1 Tax=Candidatus Taylorbacteria bacterium RIFCSPLOWO2_12_FULL_43_20 TaxID=1802332 RepID=A0A1G2NZI3_9BACT|nr:MAG: hypothetical protein A2825_01545 [Candidatus Taylorbacteria bacterium RIFCSPHIGHO2_01_FULL_43_120]OHA22191.1 MAG: hypothetical protein A3B98_01810 [Candidatus Taylorbacteria bacterium RIFCSPHIGHO2_02_FULL_43_55]OHA28041.1 MAG: hypothetical protein A3E92_04910 [Candidatus Taylorbacteria bacterium RIFCSPHIGHO2_12_FULL_42_34]OHA32274.1 MAG: hypothetical protein A3B09_02125 [Candidatus Taylorbacteria bacterium RIFCSPLOWO2_01_FULL_43_83]OHA37867.1 MAG: hypothetical protein A3H58_02155 [Candi
MENYNDDRTNNVVFSSKFSWLWVTVGVLLAIFLLAKAMHEFRLYSQEGRYSYPSSVITVSGEGEVTAIPDVAAFTFTISEEALTVDEAQKEVTSKEGKALEFLKSNNIEDKDIKTIEYNISPKYEFVQETCTAFRCPPGRQVLKGYTVSETVSVKVRETANAGSLLQGLGSVGVSNVSGLLFTVDDEDVLKSDARKMAIEDAQNKAEKLAEDLGVKLVRITSFHEDGGYPIPFAKDGLGMGGDMMRESVLAAPAIPPGENEIISRVNISYEIR